MKNELAHIKKIIKNSSNDLPLVITNIDVFRSKKTVSGKQIKIEKYRTKSYSVNIYPKNVTRFSQ